jgi:hypothetical protein
MKRLPTRIHFSKKPKSTNNQITCGATNMCLAKTVVICPNCKHELSITRPESSHPDFSLEKPKENVINEDIIEQTYTCKNPQCKAKITLYWCNAKMFLDRA